MKEKEHGPLQVEFICPSCGRHLAWALPTAILSCPRCGIWVSERNRAKPREEIYLPVDSEQTVLF